MQLQESIQGKIVHLLSDTVSGGGEGEGRGGGGEGRGAGGGGGGKKGDSEK